MIKTKTPNATKKKKIRIIKWPHIEYIGKASPEDIESIKNKYAIEYDCNNEKVKVFSK